MKRSAGILLPIFALPSKYGCGSLGEESYKFIDFLVKAKQSYWQMLPINHTGYSNSPYYCYSSFAGNPNLVDLDMLKEEGLLEGLNLDSFDWGTDPSHVDYEKVIAGRKEVLKFAFNNRKENEDFNLFRNENDRWLIPYANFMAEKEGEDPAYYIFIQYEFYKQWTKLKKYANDNGIQLIGDVPVYVPLDSADVKAEPQFFMLDQNGNPTEVAGVPPDYFNDQGQLWGNPLYNWDALKADGYGWWIRRIDGTLKMFDVVRIDHFRGFDSYWSVPASDKTAINGHWVKGPGMDFVGVICNWFGKEHFIAEDLGILSESVRQLLKDSGLPGMKVLEFAFNPKDKSSYLPHRYPDTNCICYVGTHDNAPIMQWASEASKEEIDFATKYCGCSKENINWGVIRLGMSSIANLFIAQMQDYLGLGKESRTNIPGEALGNWAFRLISGNLSDALAKEIADLTEAFDR